MDPSSSGGGSAAEAAMDINADVQQHQHHLQQQGAPCSRCTQLEADLQTLRQRAQAEQRALTVQRTEVESLWKLLEEEKERMKREVNPTGAAASSVVHVSVGGQKFVTRRTTLCSVEGSFLEALFSGRHANEYDGDCVFIDRDPKYFALILNWLRDPAAPHEFPDDPLFRHELQYYGLLHAVFGEPMQYYRVDEFGVEQAISGRLYVVGGYDGSNRLATMEKLDPESGEWLPMCSMYTPRAGAACTQLNGNLYVVGGYNGLARLSSVERYDPEEGTWTACPSMQTRRTGCACAVLRGRLYVVGGYDGSSRLDTVECFDPVTQQWETVCSMNVRRSGCGCAVLNDKLYAIGGYDGQINVDSVERYCPDTGRWVLVQSMNRPRSWCGCAAVNGHLIAVGGFDGNLYLSHVEMFNETTNTWTEIASMGTARSDVACAAVEGKLYAVGGYDGQGGHLDVVECYDISSDSWAAVASLKTKRADAGCAVLHL